MDKRCDFEDVANNNGTSCQVYYTLYKRIICLSSSDRPRHLELYLFTYFSDVLTVKCNF